MKVSNRRLRLKQGRIGLISDTHGLLRPEALSVLQGSELILHAGDIGKPEVLNSLKRVAPVLAIRGNNDRGSWAKRLPDVVNLQVNGVKLQIIHDVHELASDPAAEGFALIVSGHSHKPSVIELDGVLFVNPGSSGPRRFKLPVSLACLEIGGKNLSARIVELEISPRLY